MKNESLTIIPFIVTSVLLAIVICLFIFKFNEPKIIAEMKPQLLHGEKHSQTLAKVHADKPLSKGDRINFYIIVVCIFFCWFSFQSLQTFGSLYGELVLKTDEWGICTTALAISSLATFLPSTWLSTKIGRKWSVVSGFAVIIIAMVIAALFATKMPFAVMPVLFAFSGVGWAIVMVNSYPEFVELSHQKNVGRVTGIYYLVSQAAMFITTNVSGYVFKFAGYGFYFYYSIIFMTVALVVCLFLKTKNRGKHSLE
jgi:MFS family permease